MLLDALTGAGDRVTTAIGSASRSTGMPFDYLLKTAIRESSLDPKARATTSTARGLYQFIESTWLATVKEEGPRYGLSSYANLIERSSNGRYTVSDPHQRARILKLREDPEIASLMAGALANRNAADLSSVLGRKPTSGELYIAHFLGSGGAKRLLTLKAHQPDASAASAFPEAAKANKSIFYATDGSARSASEVFAKLTARHDRGPVQPVPASPSMATAALSSASKSVAAISMTAPAKPSTGIATALRAPAYAAVAAAEVPVFQALFRTEHNGALSPAVRELWGGVDPTSRRIAAVTPASASRNSPQPPLNLSGFLKPGVTHNGRRSGLGT